MADLWAKRRELLRKLSTQYRRGGKSHPTIPTLKEWNALPLHVREGRDGAAVYRKLEKRMAGGYSVTENLKVRFDGGPAYDIPGTRPTPARMTFRRHFPTFHS